LNLISQRLDTIYQIKPKRTTVHFLPFLGQLNTATYTKKVHVTLESAEEREIARAGDGRTVGQEKMSRCTCIGKMLGLVRLGVLKFNHHCSIFVLFDKKFLILTN
jgi:hypothetical protein